jgi:hypothetical protein
MLLLAPAYRFMTTRLWGWEEGVSLVVSVELAVCGILQQTKVQHLLRK